jgi:hypothetical protein
MKKYIDNVGKSIPNVLKMAQNTEVIKDDYSLVLYGYYEYTGFKGFFKKVKQGIKSYTWQK